MEDGDTTVYILNSGKTASFDISQDTLSYWDVSFMTPVVNINTGHRAQVVGVRNGELCIHIHGDRGAKVVNADNKKKIRKIRMD